MPNPEPKTFYRYRTFSTKTLESLCHDTLHFADPASFNDPLDCKPTLECDSERHILRRLLTFLIERRLKSEIIDSLSHVRIRGEAAESHAHRRAQNEARRELDEIAYYATNPDYEMSEEEAEASLLKEHIHRELIRHYERGVCCFSTKYDNPLLWSHYGDQHRGLCIGYHLDRTPKPVLQQVIYGGTRTIKTSTLASVFLKDDRQAQDQLDREVLLRKAKDWRYEREWRLIGSQGTQDSCLGLLDVTFGLRCPSFVQHAVVRALEGRPQQVKFYEIYEVPGSFKLKRKLVDIDELSRYLPKTAQSAAEQGFFALDSD